MNAPKHTPEVWEYDGDHKAVFLVDEGDRCEDVCAFVVSDEVGHLIAAAPDLLEALKRHDEYRCDRYVGDEQRTCLTTGIEGSDACIWCHTRAAIAKAEGRS